MCEPMKPAPPVTNAFTRARLSKRAPGEQSFFSNRADFGSWRRIGSGHFCLWHQGEAARPWERLDPDPAADSWRSRVAGLAAVAGLFRRVVGAVFPTCPRLHALFRKPRALASTIPIR